MLKHTILSILAFLFVGCTQIHPFVSAMGTSQLNFTVHKDVIEAGNVCLQADRAKSIYGNCDRNVRRIMYAVSELQPTNEDSWIEGVAEGGAVNCSDGTFAFSLPQNLSANLQSRLWLRSETSVAASMPISFQIYYPHGDPIGSNLEGNTVLDVGVNTSLQITGGVPPYTYSIPDGEGLMLVGDVFQPPEVKTRTRVQVVVKDSGCSLPFALPLDIKPPIDLGTQISQLPVGATTQNDIEAKVTSPEATSYEYVLVVGSVCPSDFVSTQQYSIATPIHESATVDGAYSLCVRGLVGVGTNGLMTKGPITKATWIRDTTPPTIPTKIENIRVSSVSASPSFKWEASVDQTSAIDHYELQIRGGSQQAVVVDWKSTNGPKLTYDFSNLQLELGGGYEALIRAVDLAGNKSEAALSNGWIVRAVDITRVQASNSFDLVSAIALDHMGHVYVGGSTSLSNNPADITKNFVNDIITGKSPNKTKAGFVARFNLLGHLEWFILLDGPGIEEVSALSANKLGQVVVGGAFSNAAFDFADVSRSSRGSADAFVALLDGETGRQEWLKSSGGSGGDYTYGVAINDLGDIAAVMVYENNLNNEANVNDFAGQALPGKSISHSQDVAVAKFAIDGTQAWVRSLGGLGIDSGKAIAFDGLQNIIVGGMFRNDSQNGGQVKDFQNNDLLGKSLTYDADGYVAMLTNSGTQSLVKSIGGSGDDRVLALAVDSQNNIYLGGQIANNLSNEALAKDSSGAEVRGVGTVTSGDAYVEKLNTTGQLLWRRVAGSLSNESTYAIAVDKYDNLFTNSNMQVTGVAPPAGSPAPTGETGAAKDFAGNYFYGPHENGGADFVTSQLSKDGQTLLTKVAGGIGIDFPFAIAVDEEDAIWSGGLFYNDNLDSNIFVNYSGNSVGGISTAKLPNAILMRYLLNGNY